MNQDWRLMAEHVSCLALTRKTDAFEGRCLKKSGAANSIKWDTDSTIISIWIDGCSFHWLWALLIRVKTSGLILIKPLPEPMLACYLCDCNEYRAILSSSHCLNQCWFVICETVMNIQRYSHQAIAWSNVGQSSVRHKWIFSDSTLMRMNMYYHKLNRKLYMFTLKCNVKRN